MNNITNASYFRLRIYYNDLSLNLKMSPSSYIVTTETFMLFWLLSTFTLILFQFYSHALILLQIMISKNSQKLNDAHFSQHWFIFLSKRSDSSLWIYSRSTMTFIIYCACQKHYRDVNHCFSELLSWSALLL